MEPNTLTAGDVGSIQHDNSQPLPPSSPAIAPADPYGSESLYGQGPGSQPQPPPPPAYVPPPAPPPVVTVQAPRPRRPRMPAPQPAPAAPAPVVAQPITPVVQRAGLVDAIVQIFGPRKKKRRNLQYIIEHRLETPVFFIVSAMMILRAAEIYSGGRLIVSQLLGQYYPIFEIVSGIGLAVGSEMLMTISGRSWKAWESEATETQARVGMSKIARTAYVNKAKQSATWSRRVMFVGMGASVFAGLAFLITNGGQAVTTANLHDPGWWWSLVVDVVATAMITTTVFYLGVLRETHAMSEAEEAIAELDEGMNQAVKAAIQRFRDGQQTPVDEKLIAEHLSPARKGKFLRAVAKVNKGKMWTSGELRKRLGIGNDATEIRRLNRKINDLSHDPDNALEKAPDNKTWLIPVRVVWETWGEDIAARDAEILAATKLTA